MPDLTSIDLPGNAAKTYGDRTLADMKTIAPGTAYSESTSTAFPTPLRTNKSKSAPPTTLRSGPGSPGPVESELNADNSGKVVGLVAGAYEEMSSAFNAIIDLIDSQLADGHP